MSPNQSPMSAVDRAWLRMETPQNPMMICGVWALESGVSMNRLRRTIEERFLCFSRFLQRVVDTGDRAYWQDDPLFDLDNHIHQIALPGKADKAELQKLASDLNPSWKKWRPSVIQTRTKDPQSRNFSTARGTTLKPPKIKPNCSFSPSGKILNTPLNWRRQPVP